MSKEFEKIFCKYCKSKINPELEQEYANGYHDECFNEVVTYQNEQTDQFDVFYDLYGKRVFNLGVNMTVLILNNLDIVVLSDSIGCFENLQELYLNKNKLTDLPLTISTTLSLLELKENKFTSIPKGIFSLDNLISLGLADNEITEISPDIGNMTNLRYLNLSNNKITSVSQNISNLAHLRSLNLSRNNFTSIPEELTHLHFLEDNLDKLNRLDLSNNKIASLPRSIKNMKNINYLILDNNILETIPDEIGNIKGLHTLSIQKNELTHLPWTLGSVLEKLDVNCNELADLPDSLAYTPLTHVNLNNNKFKIIPSCILQMNKLKYFNFNNMQLLEIPKEFFNPNLESVGFINCGLKSIPESIGLCTKMRNLDVSFNELKELPDSIGLCNKIRSLDVSFNNLTKLPDSIYNLPLRTLDISNNPVKKLSDGITNIEYLYANNTKLESLPESIRSKVIECHLRGTNIRYLPDLNPGKDPDRYIEILDIRDTPIETIPESISQVKIRRICISEKESLKSQIEHYFRISSNAFNCEIVEDPEKEYYQKKRPTKRYVSNDCK